MKIEKQAHRSKVHRTFGAPKTSFRGLFRKKPAKFHFVALKIEDFQQVDQKPLKKS